MAALSYIRFGKYGVQTTFWFAFADAAEADDLLDVAHTFVSGETQISKDGGALAATTNQPAQVTASQPIYALVLTATEMQAGVITLTIRDTTASGVFDPIVVTIYTRLPLGQMDVDATQIGGNTSAIKATGVGTGYGIEALGASAIYYHNLFEGTPAAENTTVPADTQTYAKQIQALLKRFYNRATQDGSNQKVYRNDDSTVYATMAVSDDGTTQTKGKAS